MSDIVHIKGGTLEHYDPEMGLKKIAAARGIETHWLAAKDSSQLREAVECKLREQARYVVWRDSQGLHGGDRKSRSTKVHLDLPKSDPGNEIVYRWRKKLCSKDDNNKTYANDDKIEIATGKAIERCIKACEGSPRIPKDKETIDPIQDECSDCETPQDHWQRSLENLAGDAISLRSFWTRQFGNWENFNVPSTAVTLAEQAAKEWAELAAQLKSRKA